MVAIDVISFQQIIHNLIRNAAEALCDRPEPRINLWTGSEGQFAIIAVADNGPGIDPAALNRIFEPFFTTKPDQQSVLVKEGKAGESQPSLMLMQAA
ncbi:ATP-binding protein [Rhizobium sp. BK068]|uniref:ATP-binding protein n=1 Tax=Rhizobium sp. BK068 TaxID=2512130 RepID=UPI00104D905B|nr:ATP-binding protein [Rhizobium sp. BK068]TCM71260.1 histidine kinase/DNA gyrase B/HSP90-like ATPase [Rhizobium sp. BK068]